MGRISLPLFALAALLPEIAAAACGDRGGPGYRGPDGKCLSWAALGRVCGTPPTTRCAYEGGGGVAPFDRRPASANTPASGGWVTKTTRNR